MGYLNGNNGFNWNGNGKSDAFNNYMNMKVAVSQIVMEKKVEQMLVLLHLIKKQSILTKTKNLQGISIGGKHLYDATKDSNGVTILKCILVIALCFGGIALPVATDMGTLGTLLCIFGGLGLSILILKNI